MKIVKLKRFGRIEENLKSNFKDWVWCCNFGNEFNEPKDSSLIVKFSFEKKEYPNKNKIPKFMKVKFEVVQKKSKLEVRNR